MAMIINRIGTCLFTSLLGAWFRTFRPALKLALRLGLALVGLPGQRLGLALFVTFPLIGVGGHAIALNAPEQEVIVRTLTAEQIRELTEDKTWIIDFDNSAVVSTTYYLSLIHI